MEKQFSTYQQDVFKFITEENGNAVINAVAGSGKTFTIANLIQQTQKQGIVATAKHFPGHGLVSGDTHKSLQVIDGELKEIKNYQGHEIPLPTYQELEHSLSSYF